MMGIFKRKNKEGKSRLQKWIDQATKFGTKIPDEVLMVAQMIIPAVKFIRNAINAVRKDQSMDDDLKTELIEILEAMERESEFLENRHIIDTNSDSWLSKNFRPIAGFIIIGFYIYLTVAGTYFDSADFNAMKRGEDWMYQVPETIQAQWSTITLRVVEFYFGGRALMHLARELKGLKK